MGLAGFGRAKMPKIFKKNLTSALDAEIGARIRHFRLSVGFTQKQLAKLIGVTYQQLQKYEAGSNRTSVGALLNICHALKVPVEALIGETVVAPTPIKAEKIPKEAYDAFYMLVDEKEGAEEYMLLWRHFRALKSPSLKKQAIKLISILAQC